MPFWYRLSGVVVVSEVALPATSLRSVESARTISLRVASSLVALPHRERWAERNHGVLLGEGPDGFVLRLPGHADFWIARDGTRVIGAPVDGCPEATLAQLFVDQVLPLALHASGVFSLHASAVALEGRDLVAFLGQSGAGKSTLASSLAGGGSAAAGDLLFSDDTLAVEAGRGGVLAFPSYASTRLWPESAGALFTERGALPLCSPRTAKLRAALPGAVESMPLRRIYLLERTEGAPSLVVLQRREAFMRLAGHLYRLDVRDPRRLVSEIDLLERVVSTVPVAVLGYRRQYADLPAVRRAILSDIGAVSGSSG